MNIMIKGTFDTPMTPDQLHTSHAILQQAYEANVKYIVNVGTSLIESENCLALANAYKPLFCAIGIHPNDCTESYRSDLKNVAALVAQEQKKERSKIVAIGEIGLDKHYPDYNLPRQIDAFRHQIEISLAHNLAIIVHTRSAPEETLRVLEEYRHDITRGVIHCFSEDLSFAQTVISWGLYLGIGGTVTYPRNNTLREVVKEIDLKDFVLETDAPYLAPQSYRGKKNHPQYIADIAKYVATLKETTVETIAEQTTKNASALFLLDHHINQQ